MMQLLSQLSSGENLLQTSNISSNYFDLEAQKRIAENIRLQNVQQNIVLGFSTQITSCDTGLSGYNILRNNKNWTITIGSFVTC